MCISLEGLSSFLPLWFLQAQLEQNTCLGFSRVFVCLFTGREKGSVEVCFKCCCWLIYKSIWIQVFLLFCPRWVSHNIEWSIDIYRFQCSSSLIVKCTFDVYQSWGPEFVFTSPTGTKHVFRLFKSFCLSVYRMWKRASWGLLQTVSRTRVTSGIMERSLKLGRTLIMLIQTQSVKAMAILWMLSKLVNIE